MNQVHFPFFQVKVAGHVVNHTNDRASAHASANSAGAKPAEIWQIHSDGSAVLVARVI